MKHRTNHLDENRRHQEEHLSYIMLFCALLLVRNAQATLKDSIGIVPLFGRTKHLAGEMFGHVPAPESSYSFPC